MPTKEPVDVFRYYEMRGDDECWPWLGRWGGRPGDQRPYMMSNGKRQAAYRWVYELVNGCTLNPDQPILHSCDNGNYPVGCGNPAHLSIGTNEQNMREMTERQRHGLPHHVVTAIRKLLEQGRTQQEIADLYGVSRERIRDMGYEIPIATSPTEAYSLTTREQSYGQASTRQDSNGVRIHPSEARSSSPS